MNGKEFYPMRLYWRAHMWDNGAANNFAGTDGPPGSILSPRNILMRAREKVVGAP